MKESGVERLEELRTTLKRWQEIEGAAGEHATAVIERTHNPLMKLVMEIIRQDSVMHKRVQQVILDSLEQQAFTLMPEELAEIWDLIEKHAELEQETVALAEKAQRNCRLFAQRHLLTYLIEDEKKHETLMAQLGAFKRGIGPYA